jgi:hypothetical protein
MKERYRLFLRRKSVYYAFDNTTKTFESLKTKDKAEATRLLMAMNEAGKCNNHQGQRPCEDTRHLPPYLRQEANPRPSNSSRRLSLVPAPHLQIARRLDITP